jgi:class 3 adenylate cyclase/CHASE2 domain-containing sensor protein
VYLAAVKLKGLKLTPVLVAAGVVGVVCLIQIRRPEFFDRLERITYDWRMRQALMFHPAVSTNLGFVEITDDTIKRISAGLIKVGGRKASYGLYWPRHVYGRVARELKTQGAEAIGFDVLFGELRPDHSPLLFQGEPESVNSDVVFSRLIRQAGNVVLAAEEDTIPPPLFRTNALVLGDISAERDVDGVLRRAHAFRTYRKWHLAFRQLADLGVDLRNATVTLGKIILPQTDGAPIEVPIDADRRFDITYFVGTNVPPGMELRPKAFTEERVWHMGIVLAAQDLKLDLNNADVDLDKGRIILHGPTGLERTIPVDKDGFFYINWCLTEKDPRLAKDFFDHVIEQDNLHSTGATNGLVDEWKWKGIIAIVGSGATGNDLTDRGATPLEKDAILVSKHWNVANSILMNRFIRRAGLPMELALICLLGAIATVLISTHRVLTGMCWVVAVFIAYIGAAVLGFVAFGYWAPMVLPLGGGLLTTYVCLLAYLVRFEQAEQRHIKAVFGTVVSPHVMRELLERPELSRIGGARRSVTILFADIRGFTEMTDRNRQKAAAYVKEHRLKNEAADAVFDRDARDTLDTVNRYLKTVADVILAHDGTIDKFIGDCVMAFWGAPVPDSKHALHCVRAAVGAQQAIFRLNQEREAENSRRAEENIRRATTGEDPLEMLPILSMGSGINTGVVTVGLMGSEKQLNYTIFGGDVNLASRIEKVSGRGRIIISEATLAEIIQDDANLALSCVKLPPEKFKGIDELVHIYEVPWRTGEFAPTGNTAPPIPLPDTDTRPPFVLGGHDTTYVKGRGKPV